MILYLGNMLSIHGSSVSVIETLAPRLSLHYPLKAYSSKKNKLLRLLDMVWAILFHAKSIRVVLIDAYSSPKAFIYTWFTSQICRSLNLSYIPILHGGDFPNRLQSWPRLCRMIFQYSHINIAPSGYLKAVFEKHGYLTTLIPNAIELENYPFRMRKNIKPKLLWVRAFDSETYNPQMAIRVLHQVLKIHPESELCMVGPDKDGSLAECKALSLTLGVPEKVHFTGCLPKAKWIALAADYDVFLNTTNFDNTPVSVIEAMALGLCVVSTNVGGVPYLLTDDQTGLLVEKGDESAMVRQIQRLFIEPDLAARISRGGREKAEGFSWEKVVPLWLDQLKT